MTKAQIKARQAGILAAFLAGQSNRQIAAAFGVDRSYPSIIAKRMGAPLKRPMAPTAPWPKPSRKALA